MSHNHERVECIQCETLIKQCRCASKDKITRYETCKECQGSVMELRHKELADHITKSLCSRYDVGSKRQMGSFVWAHIGQIEKHVLSAMVDFYQSRLP